MLSASILDVPRPLVDPITSLVEALSVISLALRRPRSNDTVVLALDNKWRGIHLFRTSPLTQHSLHHIVRECSDVPSVSGVVIASHTTSRLLAPSDITLLRSSQTTLAAAGLNLIDWVVIGPGGLYCPRVLTHSRHPWPHGSTCL